MGIMKKGLAAGRTRAVQALSCGLLAMAAMAPAHASGAAQAVEREYAQAVQAFRTGRSSEAFGRFVELANRGDVDSARIALFLHQYGAPLHGKQWDALPADVAYWNQLVRNSASAGRAQPEFPVTVLHPQKLPLSTARSRGSAVKSVAATR